MRAREFVIESALDTLEKDYNFNLSDNTVYVFPKNINSTDPDNAIAWMFMELAKTDKKGNKFYTSVDTYVNQEHRRKGIATAMHQFLRKHGYNIVKSNDLTDQGSQLWTGLVNKGLTRKNQFIEQDNIHEAKIGKMKKRHAAVQQGVVKARDVGGYDRTYHANRVAMAMAQADGKSDKPVDSPSASWNEKYNTYHPYTQEEWNMVSSAMKTVPTERHEVLPWAKSAEPEDTHKASPVSNWNKKK